MQPSNIKVPILSQFQFLLSVIHHLHGRPSHISLLITSITVINISGLSIDHRFRLTNTFNQSVRSCSVLTGVSAPLCIAIVISVNHSSIPVFRRPHLATSLGILCLFQVNNCTERRPIHSCKLVLKLSNYERAICGFVAPCMACKSKLHIINFYLLSFQALAQ